MTELLDADTAQRVLRRANELADHDDQSVDGYQPEAIISAALEVGIPERAARQSLAIERLGPAPESLRGDRLFGSATLWEERVIALPSDVVLGLIDQWLVEGHHLRRLSRSAEAVEWSHRDDLVAGVRRRLSGLVGEGRLARARSARASVRPIDDKHSVVRVEVDRGFHRRAAMLGGFTLGVGGISLLVVGALVAAPLLLVAVPAAVVGAGVTWSSRRQSQRFGRELKRLLDAVADARPPRGIVSGVRRRLTSTARH